MTSRPEWRRLLETAQRALAVGREIVVDPSTVRPMQGVAGASVKGQPRTYFNEGALRRLGESMRTIGQLYPGIVRPVRSKFGVIRYELLDGERRWRAAKQEKLRYRATLVDVDDSAASFIIAAVANFNREGHTPLEVSDAIENMRKMEIPVDEIADILGITPVWAYQMHGLQNLTAGVRRLMDPTRGDRDRLTVTAAVQISKAVPSIQNEIARKVMAGEVTLRGLRLEVIRMSKAAGEPIRELHKPPKRQWDSMQKVGNYVARVTKDLEESVANCDRPALTERTIPELRTLATTLEEAAARLTAAAKLIRQARKIA